MRTLNQHFVHEGEVVGNADLVITVADEPGSGGANHRYEINGMSERPNRSSAVGNPADLFILFQNGPVPEYGVNGVTHEALLAIVADRLQSFQAGPYACKENGQALLHVEIALHYLLERTKDRLSRKVEGREDQ